MENLIEIDAYNYFNNIEEVRAYNRYYKDTGRDFESYIKETYDAVYIPCSLHFKDPGYHAGHFYFKDSAKAIMFMLKI